MRSFVNTQAGIAHEPCFFQPRYKTPGYTKVTARMSHGCGNLRVHGIMNCRMPPAPSAAHQREFLAAFFKHADPEERQREMRAVFTYLVERSIAAGDEPVFVPVRELIEKVESGPKTEEAAKTCMSRIRKAVRRFVTTKQGRSLPVRGDFHWGNQAVTFTQNLGERDYTHPEEAYGTAIVTKFWAPYFEGKPARVFYPEPLFFRDGRDSIVRNIRANVPEERDVLTYLRPSGKLTPAHPYVPVGIVRAMLRLNAYFTAHDTHLEASPLRPGVRFNERNENLIVLGTSATLAIVSTLEANAPQQQRDAKAPLNLRPRPKPRADAKHYVEPVLMTRRNHLFRRNIITVLNAYFSPGVEAITRFLTSEAEMETLASHFDVGDEFPKYCQADFDVVMRTSDIDDPEIDRVTLKAAHTLRDD